MYIIIITCIHYKIRIGLTNYEAKLASQQSTKTGCWKGSVYFTASDKSSAKAILLFEPYPASSAYNTELMTLATQWT